MARRLGGIDPVRSGGIRDAALLVLPVVLLAAVPAQAQYAASCPPPKKFAAGACVTACPGGYEDRGPVCVYRNTSR
ncbi:hypothetical protein CIW48_24290 [Methylobacterium sp. P1-11]|uniref:hypothetical protein n=1 Tax=Methylobacterium sp. P1-11 TaxID=2024616 RepID=UPI0011ECEC69|nr:hypothetical protein [Methylobacterium sp. P1-11]KAA0121382.1 hypothetical protein CIW48_24290 [Methylobacterium sp. P1-11]